MVETRQAAILTELQAHGHLTIHDLAVRCEVSEITIRRDLTQLQQQGLLIRTHGGAMITRATPPQSFIYQASDPVKTTIGRTAAGMVHAGQTVLIDTGATALEVARHLPQDTGITVATTSLSVAQIMHGSPIMVILLGGILRNEFPSVYGPLTENALKSLRVDIAFMGCDGAHSREGFYTADMHLSNLERAMIRSAERAIVVAESAKFSHRALACYATPQEVNDLVTDTGLLPADHEALEEAGVHVLLSR